MGLFPSAVLCQTRTVSREKPGFWGGTVWADLTAYCWGGIAGGVGSVGCALHRSAHDGTGPGYCEGSLFVEQAATWCTFILTPTPTYT